MRIRNIILIAGLVATLIMAMPPSQIWAGGAEGNPPGAGEKLVGPEIWAVIVLYCDQNEVVVRAKRIENCIVDTQAVIKGIPSICLNPIEASDMIYQRLGNDYTAQELFGITGIPIVTKVKNFKQDIDPDKGTLYSFDAQIMFVVPE
jgi:hypothetical protein